MENKLKPIAGKRYNSAGVRVKNKPDMIDILAMYAGCSLEEVKEIGTEKEYKMLKRGRMVRSRLASAICSPKDLMKARHELVKELMDGDPDNGEPPMPQRTANFVISKILSSMADAEEMDRRTHRMVLDRRNQRAWEIAEEQKDVAAMNAADRNYIAIHQLEEEDKEVIDVEQVNAPNLMVTINYYEVAPDAKRIDPYEQIREADKLAKDGSIVLTEGKDFFVSDVEEFDDFAKQQQELEEKPL